MDAQGESANGTGSSAQPPQGAQGRKEEAGVLRRRPGRADLGGRCKNGVGGCHGLGASTVFAS